MSLPTKPGMKSEITSELNIPQAEAAEHRGPGNVTDPVPKNYEIVKNPETILPRALDTTGNKGRSDAGPLSNANADDDESEQEELEEMDSADLADDDDNDDGGSKVNVENESNVDHQVAGGYRPKGRPVPARPTSGASHVVRPVRR